MASMLFKPGVQLSGGSHSSGNSSRPSSRNANRGSEEAAVSVKRSDSSRSGLDTGNTELKPMKNNIKVAVRLRPLSDKERGRGDNAVWATDGSGGVGLTSAHAPGLVNTKYAYDLVFDTNTSNEQVFEHVGRPAVGPVAQGVSGTVFAYGVTSSGKTHTMMGTPADPGVVPRAIAALFDMINQAPDRAFTVTFSMMEIYCEMLNDLLDPSKLNLDVQERELPGARGATLLVKNLTEGRVASADAALALIQQGLDNRKVGTTAYNDQSSRSHTLCRFLVESCPTNSGSASALSTGSYALQSTSSALSTGPGCSSAATRTSAWLTLVDLAGSEGAKAALSKDQQAEARDINRSLLTLGKVVFELAKGSQGGHVPFRDSLLTRLLKPSLTGNGAKVAIICNVTPASSQSEETWNTLRFADGAKRIKVAAVKNEALDVAAVVAQYQREVQVLKAQLAALTGAANDCAVCTNSRYRWFSYMAAAACAEAGHVGLPSFAPFESPAGASGELAN
ncbi:P-loop containing nucleoside triphosphate hydrolase protein [Scenedesmus sp. NREL 46B-D3]|nr:P-loop containing nucleoside triphosphate hydrolase protein [Scenedesmus sp. NREL 46B-D3]